MLSIRGTAHKPDHINTHPQTMCCKGLDGMSVYNNAKSVSEGMKEGFLEEV